MPQTIKHIKYAVIPADLAHAVIQAMNSNTKMDYNKTIEIASVTFDEEYSVHIAVKANHKRDKLGQKPLYMMAKLERYGQLVHYQTSKDFETKWDLCDKDKIYRLYLTWEEMELTKEEPPLHVFFDLDNTLSQMTGDLDNKHLGKRAIETKTHYFRHLEPNTNMKALVQRLDGNPKVIQYIISHTLENDAKRATEHMYDKYAWRLEHYPEFKAKNIIFIPNQSVSKAEAVKLLFDRELTPNDVLIDDYNGNLTAWKNAGGTAIKLCNGQNNPDSYDGPKFLPHKEDTSVNDYLNILHQSIKRDKIIHIWDNEGFLLDTFCIKNYDKAFDAFLNQLLHKWYTSDWELTAYIYPKIKRAGYKLEETSTQDVLLSV